MIKIIIAVALFATGCETVQNSYDSKCECTEKANGDTECKCKDYDRSSIYEDYDAPGTLIYDMGDDIIFEDMESKIVFIGANNDR